MNSHQSTAFIKPAIEFNKLLLIWARWFATSYGSRLLRVDGSGSQATSDQERKLSVEAVESGKAYKIGGSITIAVI